MKIAGVYRSCVMSSLMATAFSFTAFTASAQQGALDDTKKQVPTNKQGVENAIETGKEASKPAQLAKGDAKLELARKRVNELLARKAEYAKQVASGKVNPYQQMIDGSKHATKNIDSFKFQRDSILNTKDETKRHELTDAFLTTLQPFGFFLEYADSKVVDRTLSKEQEQELRDTLSAKWLAVTQPDEKQTPIAFVGVKQLYTLLDLEAPIVLVGKPNTDIFLESTTGGEFTNGLSHIKLTTDDKGVARTRWVSHGDCVAENKIHAISKSWTQGDLLHVTVQQLKPRAVEALIKSVQDHAKQSQQTLEDLRNKANKAKQPLSK